MSRVTAYGDKTLPPAKLPNVDWNAVASKKNKIDVKLLKKVAVISAASLIVFMISVTSYQFFSHFSFQNNDRVLTYTEEVDQFKVKIGKLAILPTGEQPILELVSDPTKYSKYSFGNDLMQGDKILVYSKNEKYFAYRDTSNLLVGIQNGAVTDRQVAGAEVTATNSSVTSSSTSTKNSSLSYSSISSSNTSQRVYIIKILNGTTLSGLGSDLEKKLTTDHAEIKVSSVVSAINKNYTSNKLIILNPKSSEIAKTLSKQYGYEIIEMPTNETEPIGVDLMMIVGKK